MPDFDVAVFGAGIAGTAIANEMRKRGQSVLIIDPNASEDAPGPPGALVNPATGRRAKLTWQAEKCYDALKEQIEDICAVTGRDDLIVETGVIRPAISESLAENFRDALTKYAWPEGWIEWLKEDEIREMNSHVAENHGGIHVKSGYTVFVDNYQNAYRTYLRLKGVECKYETAQYEHDQENDQFVIQFESGEQLTAGKVIMAIGYKIRDNADWSFLPLNFVKGQIVHFEAEEPLNWDHAISARGYSIRRGERELTVGSTYEHNFENLDISDKSYDQILKKLDLMLPKLTGKVRKIAQMAGVRVTTQNRLPVIGEHPEIPKLFVYTGMNSKGFLFSHYVGELLAEHILNGNEVPDELSVQRFSE
ncbi:NAD(P)/FAD-dependent oxidoreductase [Gracilimonas amylolytica]|uniref:NAD(P)/FAD-dependent oxidoreductase n=1 Tax=Gracilimonas amylolytica TaxID=1749045 RepID=UPI000CD97BB8|nr:FAD-binding oxidoreductase [Gracilimonas amylolytica]